MKERSTYGFSVGFLSLLFSAYGCASDVRHEPTAALASALGGSGPSYLPDCNDPAAGPQACTDPAYDAIEHAQSLGYPRYVGHAEPTTEFFSSAPNSGNNMQWKLSLPATDPAPTQNGSSTASFELYSAMWLGLELCDPNSKPFGPCTANSDSNSVATSGAAFLELQFYPPGSPFGGCSTTQWCVRLHINTWQDNSAFVAQNCLEPTTQQYLTTNGSPSGAQLLMSAGDTIVATIKDTANGLETDVSDLTSGATGTMVASGANGFVHNTTLTANGFCSGATTTACTSTANCPSGQSCLCQTAAFNFHPMWATATAGHFVPWAGLLPNVSFDAEIGHWELCADSACVTKPDNLDDGSCSVTQGRACKTNTDCPAGETCNAQTGSNCGTIRGIGGCTDGDLDQDGPSYLADWADGTAAHPASVIIGSPNDTGVGPLSVSPTNSNSYIQGYDTIEFRTTDSTASAAFYPFYSQAGTGAACRFNFGNDIPGTTTNDFSKAAEYGTNITNPCFPGPVARCKNVQVSADASCQGSAPATSFDNGSSDPDGDTLTLTVSPGSPYPLGTTSVVLTATDPGGAFGTCKASIVVVDSTPPTVVAPPDVDVPVCNSGTVTVGTATVSDNCNSSIPPSGLVIKQNGVTLNPPIPVVNGQVTLGFGTYVVQWTATDGTNASLPVFQQVVVAPKIQAGGSFVVDDRAVILDTNGGGGEVLNSGNGSTSLGSNSTSGTILSLASVQLASTSRVSGDVVSGGTISPTGTVTGTRTPHAIVSLPPLAQLPAFPPATRGDVIVNNQTTTLTPGSYGSVTLNSGATLILVGGDFFFTNFFVNSTVNVRVQVVPETRVFVETQFALRSPFVNASGAVQPILLGFAGSNLTVETQFRGTLVAPKASVAFGIGSGVRYQGSFYAQNIEVRPGSSLVCDEGFTPALPINPTPSTCSDGVKDGTETDVDCGGSACVACANGKTCGVNQDCQSADCQAGICRQLTGQITASLRVFADWGTGYCADLLVTNSAAAPTTNWSVTVNAGQSTTFDTWNGNFSATTGTLAIAPAFSWNRVIPAGATDQSIGFCSNRTPSNSGALPVVVSASGTF